MGHPALFPKAAPLPNPPHQGEGTRRADSECYYRTDPQSCLRQCGERSTCSTRLDLETRQPPRGHELGTADALSDGC